MYMSANCGFKIFNFYKIIKFDFYFIDEETELILGVSTHSRMFGFSDHGLPFVENMILLRSFKISPLNN